MKTGIKSSLLIAAFGLAATSCSDNWGQMDPPAGNQVYPSLENVATYNFDDEGGLDPLVFNLVAYPDGQFPEVITDDMVESPVLNITKGGYARINNPLTAVTCQKAASLTFWFMQTSDPVLDEEGNPLEDGSVLPQDLTSPILHWENENATSTLDFSPNGWWNYNGVDGTWSENDPAQYKTGFITPDKWHYCALILRNDGYAIYIDGEKKNDIVLDKDLSGAVQLMAQAPYIYLNYGADSHINMMVDDITFYRNEITSKEISAPRKGKLNAPVVGPGGTSFSPVPDPIYFYNFERGTGTAEIVGGGELINVGGNFGTVFQNAKGGMRQNYLKLPSDVFVKAGSNNEITISMWVSAKNAGEPGEYMWCPIFSAYDSNVAGTGCPMLVCQYRGSVQQNCNGNDNAGGNWCDYTDAQCDQGKVTIRHNDSDWLADKEWHHYTATFTSTSAAVYFDGELINSWTIDGMSAGSICNIFGDSRFNLFCVGGMQAWNWGDPDPAFMFDDVAIYDHALSAEQIKTVMAVKNSLPDPIYCYNFEEGLGDAVIAGDGTIEAVGGNFGKVFQNAKGGMRKNYLQLPATVFPDMAVNNEMTVSMWVSAKNAGEPGEYMWCPIFSAYDHNVAGTGCPMLVCQYRGSVQQNCNGNDNAGSNWCDYTDAQCDQGKVTIRHNDSDWLADKEWHHYTATFSKTGAAVYFDGELINSWTIDGMSAGSICNIFGDSRLDLVCVGGMQAWNWGDPDPAFMFNNVEIYNRVLSGDQIKVLVGQKK